VEDLSDGRSPETGLRDSRGLRLVLGLICEGYWEWGDGLVTSV
jgi:hypothetical protein